MQLKFFAAAAVAVGMLSAAPAFAGDGFVDGSYANLSVGGGSGSVNAWQANFNYNSTPMAGAWGWQADIAYTDAEHLPKQYVSGQLTGFKQLESSRYGLYGSIGDAFGDTVYEGGVAGQWFGDKYSLSALAGYGRDDNASVNYWLVGGNATYYATPNFGLIGTVGYTDTNGGGSGVTVVAARAEWKPANSPVSFFGGYANESLPGSAPSINIWSIGARYNFGNKTLKDRDQHGTIMDFSQRQHF